MTIEVQRRGGKYEGCGCLVILVGLGLFVASFKNPELIEWGLALPLVGFGIFIIGRCM